MLFYFILAAKPFACGLLRSPKTAVFLGNHYGNAMPPTRIAPLPKIVRNALNTQKVKHAKPGRHADGNGLYLLVKKSGARSWVYRFMLRGKSRDLGLSRCPEAVALMKRDNTHELTLAQARDIAAIYRLKVRAGIDPLEERQEAAAEAEASRLKLEAASVTFREMAERHIEAKQQGWRNAKHRQQWRNTLVSYAYPVLGSMLVADIETPHVMDVIGPLWQQKPETASRLRGRIEAVLDAAKVRGYRSGENPARWRGHLEQLLPARQKLSRGHHKAVAYADIPDLMRQLQARAAVSALALEFTILTAARTGEVLGATWEEIDLDCATWAVPARRMKAGREHRVPLSDRAVEILQETRKLGGDYLFPGQRSSRLSGMAMSMLLRRMRSDATVHGMRSTFRDWAAERTAYPHEVCEMALAHAIANKAEAAYRRGDLFEKRRRLMNDWAKFCSDGAVARAEVVSLELQIGERA